MYDDNTHPCRRHADKLDELHTRTEVLEREQRAHREETQLIAERQDKYERSIEKLNESMIAGAAALQSLANRLENFAPLFETYQDLRATGRVIKWLMDNAKFLVVTGGCVALILKADTLLPLLVKVAGQ